MLFEKLGQFVGPLKAMLGMALGPTPGKDESDYDELKKNPLGLLLASILKLFAAASGDAKKARANVAEATPKALLGALAGFFAMFLPKSITETFSSILDPILGNFFKKPAAPRPSSRRGGSAARAAEEADLDDSYDISGSSSLLAGFGLGRARAGSMSDEVRVARDLARGLGEAFSASSPSRPTSPRSPRY